MYYRSEPVLTVPTRFRKKQRPLQSVINGILIGATANVVLAGSVFGQERAPEIITVEDTQQGRYRIDESSIGKFTENLLDTPQSVTTLSAQMMEDRNAMSLDDALRNVPGITLGAGEFSWQGNNPTIRGFNSRNDMFLDGMRDLGHYTRDPFNLESVEVLLGPSSMVFGRGSTGGVINQSTKKPFDRELRSLHVSMGNASIRRVTADFNQPLVIGDNAAFRVNLLGHQSDVPGRDTVKTERYGIAPSLSMDLGNATRLTLNYLYMDSDSIPDYGFPWIQGRPADVDRENYYGFENDYLDTQTGVGSAILEHHFSDSVSLNAQLRYADYSRKSHITEPQVDSTVSQNDPPAEVVVHRMIFSGNSQEEMLQGQMNLRVDFATGEVEHALVTGVEMASETSDPTFGFASQTPFFDYDILVPVTNLANPGGGVYTGMTARRLQSDTTSDTLAAYVLDTLKFGGQWQLSLGLRWDSFETDYTEFRYDVDGVETGSNRFGTEDTEASYRMGLVYKPVPDGTVYLGWGTSFNPSSEAVSFISSGRGLGISNVDLDPEENESMELGTKWSLLDDRLQLDAAVFRITKTNARVSDPLNPGFNTLAGEQEIKGFAVNLSGGFGDILHFTTGYTNLDDEQKDTITGNSGRIDNVAENTFNFWLDLALGAFVDMGVGTRYVDERMVANSKRVDDYWTLDAMARYEYSDNLSFKVNLLNLTDETYFDQLHPWHVIPGNGFSAVFAVNFDY